MDSSNTTFRHLVIQEPDKNIKEYRHKHRHKASSTTDKYFDDSVISSIVLPSCHPTDTTSARPLPSSATRFARGRNIFKNNRGSRLSFQSESRTYNRRVSFDSTLDALDQQHVVLRQASDGFERTRRSRVYLVPVNMDIGELDGVKFALMDLADESDEIIAVGIYSQDPDISAQSKADELMRRVMEYHQGDKISMTVEVYSGKSARAVLEEMVDIYEPSMVIVASQKRTKSSHEFSGTGIFKSALKRCLTPIIFVPTESYQRRASTGDIQSKRRCSTTPQDESTMAATRRSVSDPQVKKPPTIQQQQNQPRRRSSASVRFIIKMMAIFKKKYKIDKSIE
ncbi:hypothetical protein BDA99DRAFT_560983 [Phascolomyces articulosus]|uniref:UspA domain-containing protein n=1 Tax=Phascolomyces articulosus TaxID=60185 RepID=A0AAD5PCQ8_9FUNG|nr:hypothetical protein BDA99DRAFT_560983 [Phascolomyces articulosus]